MHAFSFQYLYGIQCIVSKYTGKFLKLVCKLYVIYKKRAYRSDL